MTVINILQSLAQSEIFLSLFFKNVTLEFAKHKSEMIQAFYKGAVKPHLEHCTLLYLTIKTPKVYGKGNPER